MNSLNAIPVVGWFLAFALCLFVGVPLYFLWNWLAPIYFYWLPSVYLSIPFWHVVGLLWLISSLRQLMLPSRIAASDKKEEVKRS